MPHSERKIIFYTVRPEPRSIDREAPVILFAAVWTAMQSETLTAVSYCRASVHTLYGK